MKLPGEENEEQQNKIIDIQKFENGDYIIKYKNGIMEQFKERTYEVSTKNLWGAGLYVSDSVSLGNWYDGFIKAPFVTININSDESNAFPLLLKKTSKTFVGEIVLTRPTAVTFSVTIGMFGKGFWK